MEDGPRIRLTDERRFFTGAPRILLPTAGISIQFDAACNQYHFDYLAWDDWFEADDTTAQSGVQYEHLAGFRLHAVLSFVIYHPNRAFTSIRVPPIDGFTELDWATMDEQRLAGNVVKFYPHGAGPMRQFDPDPYIVNVKKMSSARADTMLEHPVTLEFVGKYVVQDRPEEL